MIWIGTNLADHVAKVTLDESLQLVVRGQVDGLLERVLQTVH